MQDSKDVKLKILDGAKVLFAQKGFEGTTVRQICDQAGVALALVSYHFGGKENVLFALYDTFAPQFLNETFVLSDPEQDLRRFIGEFVKFRMEEPELINILQQEIMMQSPRAERLQKCVFALWVPLKEILEVGKEQGRFEFDSLRHTLNFIVGILIHSRVSSFFDPVFEQYDIQNNAELDTVVEHTTRFIFKGLQSRS
ncbi:transcriptional regulator, TetR family [Paenibacillus sp. 1_12]|uniref:TetR/AcrR family transcriptional regulator n=1 Tax=Paenibacillus sp. 1_12 TaxID=1566278 RepID=UPI0008EB2519|nr:TetR family transcriptional regulator [Paenibacillus sp. 1_12]SFK67557.1 transcriptional regulator, TetR family [Paenibacillus sp. 1_12]